MDKNEPAAAVPLREGTDPKFEDLFRDVMGDEDEDEWKCEHPPHILFWCYWWKDKHPEPCAGCASLKVALRRFYEKCIAVPAPRRTGTKPMNPFDYRTRLTALQKERDDARQRLDFWLKNETWESVAGCATHLQVLDAKMLIYESLQQNADATT